MTDLLEAVLEAHGGLDAWRRIETIDARLSLSGGLFEIKGHPDGLRDVRLKVDARRPRTVFAPFPSRGRRGVFEDGAVRIEADAGDLVSEMREPRPSFDGHVRATPWSELQYLYFIGYAFWNYLNTPFLLAADGVETWEVDPWEEHGQRWRVLHATFDPSIDTHCAEQRFYFDKDNMLVRLDYFTNVGRGNAAHYCWDQRVFDGFVFPTRRRVVRRMEDDTTALTGPTSVWVGLESVAINRR